MLQLHELVLDHRPDLKEAADRALQWRLKELENNVKALQKANTQNSGWRELGNFVGELSKMEEHEARFDQFYSEMAEIQRMLSQTKTEDSCQ